MLESERKLVEPIEKLMARATATETAGKDEPEFDVPDEIARREKRPETIAATRTRLEARQRETALGRSEGDERKPRKPDGTLEGGGPCGARLRRTRGHRCRRSRPPSIGVGGTATLCRADS